jgi:hypothetical protein
LSVVVNTSLDYKVVLAIIFVTSFLLSLGLVLLLVYNASKPTATPIGNSITLYIKPADLAQFVGKLTGIYGALVGVILGGIFGGANSDAPPVDRNLVALLYVLSVAWGLVMFAATFISIATPANVIDTVGAGIAVLTTTPLAFVFTSASRRSAGS